MPAAATQAAFKRDSQAGTDQAAFSILRPVGTERPPKLQLRVRCIPMGCVGQAGSDMNATQCKIAAADVLGAVLMATRCIIILYLVVDQLLPRWNPAAKKIPHQT